LAYKTAERESNKTMNHDIIFDVVGNTSAFSLMGESSGYMVTVNDHVYLLECGSPIFPYLGYRGIAGIKGIFGSHSHEDHKRWLTDIILFTFYNPLLKHKLRIISAEPILEEFAKNSKGALERSLSPDSKRIVDIPYETMVEERVIGPRSKYFIKLDAIGDGSFKYRVEDRKGNIIGPEKAKIFINPKANRPRLIFKDDESNEWVEPESYYPFSSTVFYEEDRNDFYDEKAGLTVEAIKSSVWHGLPTVAFKFMTEKNSLFFSADTVWKPSLWKELHETHRPQNFERISRDTFEKNSIIYGDINDFIERTWSRERYERAINAYKDSVVIHDIARKNSIVHTDYPDIAKAPFENMIYTHNPDNLTSLRPVLSSGKRLVIRDNKAYESVRGKLFPFDADIYIRHWTCDLVGYKSEKGTYKVIEKDELLGIAERESEEEGIMFVELYEDINGEYFPIILDAHKYYRTRLDGRIEEITLKENSSSGNIVESVRGKIKTQDP
jgi:ribonuclease BN (tRNA processing enzyme)